MTAQDPSAPTAARVYENDSIAGDPLKSTVEILVVLARRKLLIVEATLILTVAAAVGLACLRDTFKAEAVILPPQQQQSSLASFASGALPLGSLAGMGMASQLGLKNPADIYVGILKSDTIADGLIAQFHLVEIYRKRFVSDTRRALQKHASIASGKDSLITISVEDHDPKRAAALANAFVDELYKLNSKLAITDASQRRLFFEERLSKEKAALSEAEVALKNTQQSTGLVVPSGQAEVLIRSAAELRARIASREVTLQGAASYATDHNPQIQIQQREISTMQAQLAKIENNGTQDAGLEVSGGKLPEAGLEYIRKLRSVKYHETLYEMIAKQYEAAVIDEARQAPVIQVIDRATVPDKKSGPPRSSLIFVALILGAALSSSYVLLVHLIKGALSTPELAESVTALRSALRFAR